MARPSSVMSAGTRGRANAKGTIGTPGSLEGILLIFGGSRGCRGCRERRSGFRLSDRRRRRHRNRRAAFVRRRCGCREAMCYRYCPRDGSRGECTSPQPRLCRKASAVDSRIAIAASRPAGSRPQRLLKGRRHAGRAESIERDMVTGIVIVPIKAIEANLCASVPCRDKATVQPPRRDPRAVWRVSQG